MTACTRPLFECPACQRWKVEAEFKGGSVTSAADILLLRQTGKQAGWLLGLTARSRPLRAFVLVV